MCGIPNVLEVTYKSINIVQLICSNKTSFLLSLSFNSFKQMIGIGFKLPVGSNELLINQKNNRSIFMMKKAFIHVHISMAHCDKSEDQ